MEVTEAKRAYRLQERMKRIQERCESGLSVKDWCTRNNIREGNYYYWLREIRKSALQEGQAHEQTTEHVIVRVELPKTGLLHADSAYVHAIRLQYKDSLLDIPSGTAAGDISIVLQALNGV